MEAGRLAAGSGRAGESHRVSAMGAPMRLDPFSLPVRFTAADEAADERLRVVDLHRERVVLRRSVRGMRMALNLPVAAFRGVAIRLVFADADQIPSCNRGGARTRRSRSVAAAVCGHRERRHRRRMAILGPRARPAAPRRRNRRLACASRSPALARFCASTRRPGGGGGAAPSRGGGRADCCGVDPASRRTCQSCIATSARSSPEIEGPSTDPRHQRPASRLTGAVPRGRWAHVFAGAGDHGRSSRIERSAAATKREPSQIRPTAPVCARRRSSKTCAWTIGRRGERAHQNGRAQAILVGSPAEPSPR